MSKQRHRRTFVLSFVHVAVLLVVVRGSAAPPEPISAKDAASHVGKPEVLVRLQVAAAKDRIAKRGIIFLDSEADFHHPDNLGVAVAPPAAAEFRRQGIEDLATHLLGKTIVVRGVLMRFEERLYLPVLAADQIQIVEPSDATPKSP